jgi:hypothetical protein
MHRIQLPPMIGGCVGVDLGGMVGTRGAVVDEGRVVGTEVAVGEGGPVGEVPGLWIGEVGDSAGLRNSQCGRG